MDAISVISTIFALSGNLLVNFKMKIGFLVWCVSNVTWVIYNFVILPSPNWSMIIMYIVYFVLNIMGFIMWSKKGEKVHGIVQL